MFKVSRHLPFILRIYLPLSFFVSMVDVAHVFLWWSGANRLSPPHEWHTCSIVRPLCIIAHSHTNRAAKVALSPVNYLGWVITCLFGIVLWSPVRPAPVQNVLLHLHLLSGPHSSVSNHLLFTTRPLLNHFRLYLPFRPTEG